MDELRDRRVWLALSQLTAAACLLGAVAAAAAGDRPADDLPADDEIVVTGSRLHRGGDVARPGAAITRLEIDRRGLSNAYDAVRTNPMTGLGVSSAGTQASLGVGSAFVDLFDLGSQRTLTLIDGRRAVSGNQSTLFGQTVTGLQVDLNIVPTALIERIEIIPAAGAPIYGADAIGGTVNVILKRDYEGTELDSQYGAYEGGFGATWRARILHGATVDDGRGNVTLALEHAEVEGFDYARGAYLNRLPALAPNPLNGRPFTTAPEPNGVTNNVFFMDLRQPAVTTGGLILRAPGVPDYLSAEGRRYLLEHPEAAAANPYFALNNGTTPANPLITRAATLAEIEAGARNEERPGGFPGTGPARIAVPLRFSGDGSIVPMDVGLIRLDQPLSGAFASGGDGLSLVPYSSLQSQLDRTLVSLRTSYRLDAATRLSADLHYARVRAIEPANQPAYNGALFSGASGVLGFRTDNPFLGDQARAILNDPAYNLTEAAQATVPLGWAGFGSAGAFAGCGVAGMPADIAAGCPAIPAGTRLFYASRALEDLTGTAPSRTDTDTLNAVVGLDGDLPVFGPDWTYDVSLSYGRSSAQNRNVSILQAQFNAARDAVRAGDAIVCRVNAADPAERRAARFPFLYTNVPPAPGAQPLDPSSPEPPASGGTTYYRRSVGDPLGATEASLDACAPLNLFGDGAPSEAARAYVVTPLLTANVNEQVVFEFNASGSLARLAAGDVAFATGLSWRYEGTTFEARNDAAHNGLARAVAYGDIVDRSFSSLEYYAETVVPLLGAGAGIPLVKGLELNASARAIDNTLAGRDEAWGYGLTWHVTDDLVLRAGQTRSVRSPSLTELYLPPSGTFQAASDPCDVRFIAAGSSPAIRRANCEAQAEALGFSKARLAGFTSLLSQVPSQGQLDGNDDLRNEHANAQTLGFIYRTDAPLGDLSLSVDYVAIKLDDAIESLSLTKILEACYDDPVFPNRFCSRVVRLDATHLGREFQIDFGSGASPAFRTTYVNVGRREYEGIVAGASWTQDLNDTARLLGLGDPGFDLGLLDLSLAYTYTDRQTVDLTGTGQNIDILEGEIGRPINEHQLTATYLNGPFTWVWVWVHQGEAVFDAQALPENREQFGVEAYDLFHTTLLYDLDERVEARLTVNNVFDVPPPFGSGSLAYDQVGRFFQAGLKVRF